MKATESVTSGKELGPVNAETSTESSPAELRQVTQTASTVAVEHGAGSARRESNGKKNGIRIVAAVAAVLIAAYTGWRWWDHARTWVRTDNAYIAAHVHTVSSRVTGTVQEVFIDENQTVAPGSVLARLDPRDFQVRQQQAEANLAQARAQRHQASAKVSEAQAQIAREKARAGKSRLDLERAKALFEGASGAISKQELDQAQAEGDGAEAALQAAESAAVSAEALVVAAEAQEREASANLEEARLQLSYAEIHAPAGGRIGKKNLEVGNRVQSGQPLLALVQPEVWVTANFKETQLARMKPGQEVEIRLDAYPSHVFTGRIESLSPATGAQFALLPPDNATGNFTKIVQRVPVRIILEGQTPVEWKGCIVPGMSAVVEVRVRG